MKKTALVLLCIVVGALSGCGNFEWFPSAPSVNNPSQFTFSPATKQDVLPYVSAIQPFSVISSGTITVAGLTTGTTSSASVTTVPSGAVSQFSINGAWNPTSTTVQNGDIVKIRHNAATSVNSTITTTLSIGLISSTFSSTTEPILFAQNPVTGTGSVPSVGGFMYSTQQPILSSGETSWITTFPTTATLDNSATYAINTSSTTAFSSPPITQSTDAIMIRVPVDASTPVNTPVTTTIAIPTGSGTRNSYFTFTWNGQ